MELINVSKSINYQDAEISRLSVDSLNQILAFVSGNGLFKLVLTGHKRLIAKLKRTEHVSLEWSSFAYLDWNRCSPFIKWFSDLQTLQLTTWSPDLLCRDYMRAGFLPPSLTFLSMNFSSAFQLISPEYNLAYGLFAELNSLETLIIAQNGALLSVNVDIRHFPKSLRTLRILTSQKVPQSYYSFFDIQALPPLLETLQLSIIPNFEANSANMAKMPLLLGYGVPDNLASLTSLSLMLTVHHGIDTQYVAANLEHLEVLGGGKVHHRKVLVRLNLDPIADIYPRLKTLRIDGYQGFAWSQLRNLPPSLTALGSRFYSTFFDAALKEAEVARLNEEYTISENNPTHAVPMRLRAIENFRVGGASTMRCDSPLLSYLPSLCSIIPTLKANLNQDNMSNIPKGINQLSLEHINISSITSLPPNITSLEIGKIVYEGASFKRSDSKVIAKGLSGITSLTFTHAFPMELVRLLPRSLESLSVAITDSSIMEAIALFANEGHLPNLHSLTYAKCTHSSSHAIYVKGFELSMAVVPLHLKALYIEDVGPVSYPLDWSLSLVHHKRLTRLHVIAEVEPVMALRNLPPGLLDLNLNFKSMIQLEVPEQALALYAFREAVPHLKRLVINPSAFLHSSQDVAKFLVVPLSSRNRPTVSLSRWLSLPRPLQQLYMLAKVRLVSSARLAVYSETFALSCIPRTVSDLVIPTDRPHAFEESDGFNLLLPLHRTLKYQFPLLGFWLVSDDPLRLVFPYGRITHTQESFVKALPPQISSLEIAQNSGALVGVDLSGYVYGLETGFTRQILHSKSRDEKPWTSMSESMYHITNLTGWILMLLLAPKSWMSPWWIKLYLWNNVLGSAIVLPFVIRKWLSSQAPSPKYHLLGSLLPGPVKIVVCLVVHGLLHAAVNLPLCFSSVSNYGLLGQGLALAASFIVSQVRNAFV